MPSSQDVGDHRSQVSASRDIPFNKLVLSQANVRRIKRGQTIEDLAVDITRRGLLQSLNVRAVIDPDGLETGMFEIPAGGRRYRALELLVKQKRMSKTTPVPCIVRDVGSDISAEEDSLAENVHREDLHPLDQFRAFQDLRERGVGEEETAARFFVPVSIVRQRLKLAAVSPSLLDVYAEDGMTLEQLMAFTVNTDHARQEQVWEALKTSWSKEPSQIRRMLTENTVRVADRRIQFVTVESYEAAGGLVLRDLFESDDGGWIEDIALLDRMVTDKLKPEAETIATEGWKWIEVAVNFPYGYYAGLTQIAFLGYFVVDRDIVTPHKTRAPARLRCLRHCSMRSMRTDRSGRHSLESLTAKGSRECRAITLCTPRSGTMKEGTPKPAIQTPHSCYSTLTTSSRSCARRT